MTKSDGPRVWANRLLSFVAGGLLVLIIMSLAVVSPVKSENVALTKQLDELENGAARLLGEAGAYMANGSYSNALRTLETLLEKHPGSNEAVEGKTLSAEITTVIALNNEKWEASMTAVRSAWEKSTAAKLRADADAVRQGVDATMADTLDAQWEQNKTRIRQEWEGSQS